jgi:hypothetical protein
MSCAWNGWSSVSSADLVNNPPGRCQLAQLRKNTGLTQVQVAALRGVSQARVSQIEHGTVTCCVGGEITGQRATVDRG